MAEATGSNECFVFVFPMASGHINPSLPIARSLAQKGNAVHYVCREQMRDPIEDTGATLYLDSDIMPELYSARKADLFGALAALKEEHGVQDSFFVARMKMEFVQIELMLPGLLRFLREHTPAAVVYDPIFCREAAIGAKICGIPSVALLTTAGPGSIAHVAHEQIEQEGKTAEQVYNDICSFAPRAESLHRIQECYGYAPSHPTMLRPVGIMYALGDSEHALVTTIEPLQDPVSACLQEAYDSVGASFVSVGALLDQAGAVRAAGHKFTDHASTARADDDCIDVLAQVREARAGGRRVILVSMGTVITGDHPEFGWNGRTLDEARQPHGLTGRELCHAAWAGSFEAFGEDSRFLILVSLGPQPNALEDLAVPSNAICMPSLPQVDILKAGVDVFLTHGGQNSFTEAMASGTPVVVCPGFSDQPVNARKAVSLGVGLKVDRPRPASGEEAAAAEAYCIAVRCALMEVASAAHFASAAQSFADALGKAGGVPRAVDTVLEAAATVAPVPRSPSFAGA